MVKFFAYGRYNHSKKPFPETRIREMVFGVGTGVHVRFFGQILADDIVADYVIRQKWSIFSRTDGITTPKKHFRKLVFRILFFEWVTASTGDFLVKFWLMT